MGFLLLLQIISIDDSDDDFDEPEIEVELASENSDNGGDESVSDFSDDYFEVRWKFRALKIFFFSGFYYVMSTRQSLTPMLSVQTPMS